jgi:hypothetical protein
MLKHAASFHNAYSPVVVQMTTRSDRDAGEKYKAGTFILYHNYRQQSPFFFWEADSSSASHVNSTHFMEPVGSLPNYKSIRPPSVPQTLMWFEQTEAKNLVCMQAILTLSDPTSDLVRHYDFPVPLRCRKTSDTVFVAFVVVCSRYFGSLH